MQNNQSDYQMMKKLIYKIDKQIRPKKRFFDGLEHIDKLDPKNKDVLNFIKENMKKHNKLVLSGKANKIKSFRALKSFEKYDLLADFYLGEYRLSVLSDTNIYNLSRKLRTMVTQELCKANKFSDAFSYAKRHKLPESEIMKDTLVEIDRKIKETEANIRKNLKKTKELTRNLILSLSFNRDYAKANNYLNIASQLKEKADKLEMEYN